MTIAGDFPIYAAALGHEASAPQVQAAFALAAPDEIDEPYEDKGSTYQVHASKTGGVAYTFKDDALLKVAVHLRAQKRYEAYARSVVDGIEAGTDRAAVAAALGTPTKTWPHADRFEVEGLQVQVSFVRAAATSIVIMISAN